MGEAKASLKSISNGELVMVKTKLLSIDAWRDSDNLWFWNAWYTIEKDIFIESTILESPRKLLKLCRDNGWLTEGSKGHLKIEDDGWNVIICKRSNGEPLLALEYDVYYENS